jgi:hypothetical protein
MTVLTGPGPDGGPSIPVRITLDDIQSVARDFILAQADCLVVMNALHNKLWDNSRALGSDTSAKTFGSTYDPAAQRVFAGFVRIHGLLGAIGVGLSTSAANHAKADAASTVPGHPQVDQIPALRCDPPINELDVPPLADGAPSWMPSQLQPVWPSYDDGKTGAVKQAYLDAAGGIEDVFTGLRTALRSLFASNDSADLQAFGAFMAKLDGPPDTIMVAFPALLRALCGAIGDYTDKVDAAQETINEAIAQALEAAGLAVFLAAILDEASDGLAALLTKPEAGAVIAMASRTMAPIASAVSAAVSGSELVIAAATAAGAFTAAMANAPDPNIETSDATQLGDTADPAINRFGQTEQDLNDLGMDPATGRYSASERDSAIRVQDQTGVKLTRSKDPSYDWEGSDGKKYDAVGNFPGQYFDGQWENLKRQIVRHLTDKAEIVPVDVSQFSAAQVAQVRDFIAQYSPRAFIVGE